MILRVVVEYKFLFVPATGVAVEARCKASSCRATAWKTSGDLDFVMAAVRDHLHVHGDDFALVEQTWRRATRVSGGPDP